MSSYTIPNVIAQHPRGERIMDVYSHLLTERIVYLGTAIDPGVANALIVQLLHLEAESPEQEINLYINCEGGDLPPMLAVYDTMRYIQAPVATSCVRPGDRRWRGAARGWNGRPRSLLPHARVVLHQPAARGQGPIPDLILQADEVVARCGPTSRRSCPCIRASPGRRCAPTPTATGFSRPGERWTTGIVDQVLGQRFADAAVRVLSRVMRPGVTPRGTA